MKNNLFLAAAFFTTVAANAQTPDSAQQKPALPVVEQTVVSDTTINQAYIADREALRSLTTETLRPEHAFPVLGSFSGTGSSSEAVTVTLDSVNKGMVWVDGLQQGHFKAYMKKAPATYKIPAQKTQDGKSVAEGTLFYNPASKELTIVMGRPFNDADPSASLAVTSGKQKNKAWQYTGLKAGAATTPTSPTQQ